MNILKLSDATKVIPIYMADSAAPLTGKTGLTLSVTLSKNGAAFGSAAGSVTELVAGHYVLTPTSADSGTLGSLVVKATAAGAVDFSAAYRVVAFDPYAATNLGLSNLDASVASRSTYSGGPVDSVTNPVTVGTNNDKTGYKLAADGLDSITVETGVNARQALSPILAATAGVMSGATAGASTIVIKGGNVALTRINASTDEHGNRTSVTLTLPI